jgi:prepilin-type N-terminal cleavage/methylation domain-containing protein
MKKPMPARSKGWNRGFTMVEAIMVIFIMAVAVGAVYGLFYRSQRVYVDQDKVVSRQQTARAAMDMICQELQLVGYDPDANRPANAGFRNAPAQPTETNPLWFTMDLDGDRSLTGANEDLRYYLYTGSDGVRRIARQTLSGEWSDIADSVSAFEITYYVLADGSFRGISVDTTKESCARRVMQSSLANFETSDPANDSCLNGTPSDRLEAIRRVRLRLTTEVPQSDPGFRGQRAFTLNADLALRNLVFIR